MVRLAVAVTQAPTMSNLDMGATAPRLLVRRACQELPLAEMADLAHNCLIEQNRAGQAWPNEALSFAFTDMGLLSICKAS